MEGEGERRGRLNEIYKDMLVESKEEREKVHEQNNPFKPLGDGSQFKKMFEKFSCP